MLLYEFPKLTKTKSHDVNIQMIKHGLKTAKSIKKDDIYLLSYQKIKLARMLTSLSKNVFIVKDGNTKRVDNIPFSDNKETRRKQVLVIFFPKKLGTTLSIVNNVDRLNNLELPTNWANLINEVKMLMGKISLSKD